MRKDKVILLIVEDDPGLQKQMRWSFDAYETLVAGDRESALVQLRRHEPAVVTLDLGLAPDPDGVTGDRTCVLRGGLVRSRDVEPPLTYRGRVITPDDLAGWQIPRIQCLGTLQIHLDHAATH